MVNSSDLRRVKLAAMITIGTLTLAAGLAAGPANASPSPTTAKASAPSSVKLRVASQTIPVTCTLSQRTIGSCDVTLVYRNTRGSYTVGGGRVSPGSSSSSRSVTVPVSLNSLGHYLAALGPVPAAVLVRATPYGSRTSRSAAARTEFVNWRVYVPRAVYFDEGSATIRPADYAYLDSLRGRLSKVKTTLCIGNTNFTGFYYGDAVVAQQRAVAVCDYVTKGTSSEKAYVNNAQWFEVNDNSTEAARAQNRRVDLQFDY